MDSVSPVPIDGLLHVFLKARIKIVEKVYWGYDTIIMHVMFKVLLSYYSITGILIGF